MSEPRTAPGPRGHLLIGSLPELRQGELQFFLDLAREYGDIARAQIGPIELHLLRHPDYVKHVLQDNSQNYGRKTRGFLALRDVLGDSLLTTVGDFWRRQRRIAQPAFHRQRLAGFADLMVAAARDLADSWAPLADRKHPIDVVPEFLRVTLRILGLSMFGLDLSSESSAIGGALVVALERTQAQVLSVIQVPEFIPTPQNRRFKEAMQTLDRIVFEMIGERRRSGREEPDLLGMLMAARDEESGEGMTDRQLRDELITILLAGHETTAMALSWACYLLSKHPAVWRTLRAEVRGVLGDRPARLPDLQAMPYLRMVLDETMRLYPPAWMVARSVNEDDVIGGYRIPAGSLVFTSPYVTHRHPDFWDNPEGFDPDRHTPERAAARPRYAYFPFGGGPHLCIGQPLALMEAQLVLATLMQRYQLDLEPGLPVVPQPLVTLRPEGGLRMTVQPIRD